MREPVTATRIGPYTVFGFSPRRSQSAFRAVSIVAASTARPPRARRRVEEPSVEQHRVGLDVVEEEPGELLELAEPTDLLLDERRRGSDALVPVAALLSEDM